MNDSSADRDLHIQKVFADYQRRVAAGESPSIPTIVEQYPQWAPELEQLLRASMTAETLPPQAPQETIAPQTRADKASEDRLAETQLAATLPPEQASSAANKIETPSSTHTLQSIYGSGGMGNVWLARDGLLNRDVAYKELRPERAARADLVRDFWKEAQITAQLEHPNIVPIYQLGAGEKPFYTMRLAPGPTLSDAIGQYHQAPQQNEAMELRRLLGMMIAICNALAYAHSRGVIHRDLKPQNVVLGDFGEVIVLDWGLAKILASPENQGDDRGGAVSLAGWADTEKDDENSIVGTPAYMAPEQAGGEPSTPATDIYGLGAILMEILTGKAPHQGKQVQTLLRRIIDSPTPRARSRAPRTPAALDAICAKAMAYQPTERYASASEMATDLERWLADEPVSAHRERWPARAARWARRNKAWVIGAAVLLIAATIGLAVNTAMVRREKQRTTAALGQTLRAVDQMLTKVGQERLANIPQMSQVRKELLEEALAFYRDFLKEKPNDPELRRELAQAHYRVADILRKLGKHAEAVDGFQQAIAMQQAILQEYPDHPETRAALADSYIFLGESRRAQGQHAEALQAYDQSQKILEVLVEQFPREDYQRALALAHINRGLTASAMGESPRAVEAYEAAIALLEPFVLRRPDDDLGLRELARSYLNLGLLLKDQKQAQPAEQAFQEAIELYQTLSESDADNHAYRQELAAGYTNLGNLLVTDPARRDAAAEAYSTSLKLCGQLTKDYPSIPLYKKEWANALNSLGSFYFFTQRLDLCEQQWRAALEPFRDLVQDHPGRPEYQSLLGATAGNLGYLLTQNGKLTEAQTLLTEAIRHQQRALEAEPKNPSYLRFLQNHCRSLADASLQAGDHRQAEQAAERLAALPSEDGKNDYRAATILARAAEAASHDETLDQDQQTQAIDRYAKRTIAMLDRLREKGFTQWERLREDDAFAKLRQREDFQQFAHRAQSP